MLRPFLSLIAFLAGAQDVVPVRADTCSNEIAQLEALIQSMKYPIAKPTLPQSIDAKLHHQPTLESVRRAEEAAQLRFAVMLAQAKILNAHGRTNECVQSVAEARRVLAITERDASARSNTRISRQ
jgi:hypothetical protein